MSKCDVCGSVVEWPQGYLRTTTQVAISRSYWETLFRDRRPEVHTTNPDGSGVAPWVQFIAGQLLPWLVCEQCSPLFEFDRAEAKQRAIEKIQPDGAGPADEREVALVAAHAWHRVFGRWPISVRDESWTEGSSCSFCGKGFSPDEQLALVSEDSLGKMQSISGFGAPLEAPVIIKDRKFWKVCSLCVNRPALADQLGIAPSPQVTDDQSTNVEQFFQELDAWCGVEREDTVHIGNSTEVLDANRLPRGEAQVRQFEGLCMRYPQSGNVCGLYAQALAEAGQGDVALFVAQRSLSVVSSKADVTTFLALHHLRKEDFAPCIRWFIRTAVLDSSFRPASSSRFRFVYLAGFFSALGRLLSDDERRSTFAAVGGRLAERSNLGLEPQLRERIVRLALQCDKDTESLMAESARRYGW